MKNGHPRQRGKNSVNVEQAGNIVDYMMRTGNENQYLQSGARNISVTKHEKETEHGKKQHG